MTNSMKDLLVGLGFKPAPADAGKPQRNEQPRPRPAGEPARKPHQAAGHARHPQHARPQHARPQQEHGRPPQQHAKPQPQHARPAQQPRPQRTREEMDLARAYALRAQKEKDERIEAERLKQEAAQRKREAKARIAELLKDKTLNDANAELTRHFDYNGKIRRVHVDEAQLKALNAGALGVVQLDGRYLLVDAATARQVEELLPSLLALLVDPDAPASDDPYADPKYVVPDDLVW